MNIVNRAVDRVKAALRGEKRVAPNATRGRIYARKEDTPETDTRAKASGKLVVRARVQRAGSDTWEDRGVISSANVTK